MESMIKLIGCAFLTFQLATSAAQAELDGYVPPQLTKSAKPRYPAPQFADANERSVDDGLVEVLFMVNRAGKPFSPKVLRASMAKFIDPALKALDEFEFKPATIDGQPVEAMQILTLDFKLSAADLRSIRGSTSSFTSTRERGVPDGYQSYYDEFTELLAKPDSSEAELAALLDRMIDLKHQSYYSLAYHSLARFRFAERFGDAEAKMEALNDLVWFDPYVRDKYRILQDDLESVIWTNLLKLQIESGKYAEALATYQKTQQLAPKVVEPFSGYIEQIRSLRESDQFTQRELRFKEGQAIVPLLKRSFTFSEVSADFELDLYCETKRASLDYVAESQYEIPADWGDCLMIIDAPAGTQGKLLEQ